MHVVLLHYFREMLLWVLIHGCMYSYLLLLLLLHYGRISIEECLYITLTQLSQQWRTPSEQPGRQAHLLDLLTIVSIQVRPTEKAVSWRSATPDYDKRQTSAGRATLVVLVRTLKGGINHHSHILHKFLNQQFLQLWVTPSYVEGCESRITCKVNTHAHVV